MMADASDGHGHMVTIVIELNDLLSYDESLIAIGMIISYGGMNVDE